MPALWRKETDSEIGDRLHIFQRSDANRMFDVTTIAYSGVGLSFFPANIDPVVVAKSCTPSKNLLDRRLDTWFD